ncbi:hypothetical protein GY45DRAFT_669782 [Cubamyces sp. BRFM 1775]|nr:hypothetical protein GY45DRAFT_669782 [Cubamyces sp. BRFM 1775]
MRDIEDQLAELEVEICDDIEPLFTLARIGYKQYGSCAYLYHRNELNRFVSLMATRVSSGLSEQSIIKHTKRMVRRRARFVKLVRRLRMDDAYKRREEKQSMRRARASQLRDRLVQLGWGEELSKLSDGQIQDLYALGCVDQTDPVTDHGWREIQDKVIEHMEATRALRRLRI